MVVSYINSLHNQALLEIAKIFQNSWRTRYFCEDIIDPVLRPLDMPIEDECKQPEGCLVVSESPEFGVVKIKLNLDYLGSERIVRENFDDIEFLQTVFDGFSANN